MWQWCNAADCGRGVPQYSCWVGSDCSRNISIPGIRGARRKPIPSAGTSCSTLLSSAPSGKYMVDTDGAGPLAPFTVYCDMKPGNGGWTLVAVRTNGQHMFTEPDWNPADPAPPVVQSRDCSRVPRIWDINNDQFSFREIRFTSPSSSSVFAAVKFSSNLTLHSLNINYPLYNSIPIGTVTSSVPGLTSFYLRGQSGIGNSSDVTDPNLPLAAHACFAFSGSNISRFDGTGGNAWDMDGKFWILAGIYSYYDQWTWPYDGKTFVDPMGLDVFYTSDVSCGLVTSPPTGCRWNYWCMDRYDTVATYVWLR
jgi:hypothetical protein